MKKVTKKRSAKESAISRQLWGAPKKSPPERAAEEELPPTTETLARHLKECLTFYRFPERHWKRIRTSNVIEQAFKEVKRRTRMIGHFPNETSVLVMVFSILEGERSKWQKVRMRADDIARIEETAKALEQEPIRLELLEEALVA